MAEIIELADQTNRIGVQAKHLVCELKNNPYHEYISVIEDEEFAIRNIFVDSTQIFTDNIKIYPNPVGAYSIIEVNNLNPTATNSKFYISDITGKIIKEYFLLPGINYLEISNKELAPGIYYAYMSGSRENIFKPFVVID